MDTQIRKLRKEKGLSQAQLAGALKYDSPATIIMWESGNRKPPADKPPERRPISVLWKAGAALARKLRRPV